MQLPICRVYEQKEECCLEMPCSDFIAGLQYSGMQKRSLRETTMSPTPFVVVAPPHPGHMLPCKAVTLHRQGRVIPVKDSVTKTTGDKSFDARKPSIMFLTKRKQCPVLNGTLTANPGTAAMVQWHAMIQRTARERFCRQYASYYRTPWQHPCIYHLVEKQTEGKITVQKLQIKS